MAVYEKVPGDVKPGAEQLVGSSARPVRSMMHTALPPSVKSTSPIAVGGKPDSDKVTPVFKGTVTDEVLLTEIAKLVGCAACEELGATIAPRAENANRHPIHAYRTRRGIPRVLL
jgi:hypothetical protein